MDNFQDITNTSQRFPRFTLNVQETFLAALGCHLIFQILRFKTDEKATQTNNNRVSHCRRWGCPECRTCVIDYTIVFHLWCHHHRHRPTHIHRLMNKLKFPTGNGLSNIRAAICMINIYITHAYQYLASDSTAIVSIFIYCTNGEQTSMWSCLCFAF